MPETVLEVVSAVSVESTTFVSWTETTPLDCTRSFAR
jgi:hypothetical protein